MAVSVKNKQEEEDFLLIDDDENTVQHQKFLTFLTERESYGINIRDIIEIIEIQKIIEVPDTPEAIKGVINLRGRIIPVMDVRIRFNIKERAYDDRTCIVVVTVKNTTLGFIVDTVEEVVEIPEEHIEPAPRFRNSNSIRSDYIMGLGKVNDQVKILLDIQKILFNEELENISELNGEADEESAAQ